MKIHAATEDLDRARRRLLELIPSGGEGLPARAALKVPSGVGLLLLAVAVGFSVGYRAGRVDRRPVRRTP